MVNQRKLATLPSSSRLLLENSIRISEEQSFQVFLSCEFSEYWKKPFSDLTHFNRAFFTIASYISALSMITTRIGGTWNRSLVAGAKPIHFLWSHFMEGLIIVLIQQLEYSFYTIFIFEPNLSLSASILLPLLLLSVGLAGLCFGLMLSAVMGTVMESFMISQFFVYPASFISGT